MKPKVAADLITTMLVLLFCFTAATKLPDHQFFRSIIKDAWPHLKGAAVLAWGTPLTRLCIVLLLIFPVTGVAGLHASAALLVLFTIYLLRRIVNTLIVPCSCGIIDALTPKGQVVLNFHHRCTNRAGYALTTAKRSCANKAVATKQARAWGCA